MSFTVLSHVIAQAALQKRSVSTGAGAPASGQLSRTGFKALLSGLRDYIGKLTLPDQKTVWGDYANNTSYATTEAETKRRFVAEAVASAKPNLLFDLGCNTGDYSQAAFDAGAEYVVGFDFDHGALERAYDRFCGGPKPFLPLWLDAANPSPSQGWNQQERKGLAERSSADFLIALAFIHHIVIGRNVPLGMAMDWLMSLAPAGVIEFPPKSDPMVQRLLSTREDIFPDYTTDAFLAELSARGRLVRTQQVSENGRLLAFYDRRP